MLKYYHAISSAAWQTQGSELKPEDDVTFPGKFLLHMAHLGFEVLGACSKDWSQVDVYI